MASAADPRALPSQRSAMRYQPLWRMFPGPLQVLMAGTVRAARRVRHRSGTAQAGEQGGAMDRHAAGDSLVATSIAPLPCSCSAPAASRARKHGHSDEGAGHVPNGSRRRPPSEIDLDHRVCDGIGPRRHVHRGDVRGDRREVGPDAGLVAAHQPGGDFHGCVSLISAVQEACAVHMAACPEQRGAR